MSKALSFQQVILRLHEYWAAQDCLIWEPYNVQVGAGTGNPATTLRVLGPEPWRVAYVEPSVRPDDGRFGENPNRMQKYYQYQVILKPDPGNPQELYLASLEALGINPREHDIRFVEDNWESPALGAWGLGWEVWLDGQEITQFTYFQQAGGMTLDPVSVEITYGIERIVLALQGKDSAWQIDWLDGVSYGDVMFDDEVEHCRYYFDVADVDALRGVYDTYEREYARALEGDALISAYDYVLKCSHLFNVLDTRGAIGVTERAAFFRRMRDMTRAIANEYVQKREQQGFPLLKMADKWRGPDRQPVGEMPAPPTEAADVLIEIGVEEMPADDVTAVAEQLSKAVPVFFEANRLEHPVGQCGMVGYYKVSTSPRRILIYIRNVAHKQRYESREAIGPPEAIAFDENGKPTAAALGFAKAQGVDVSSLKHSIIEIKGGRYVFVIVRSPVQSTIEVLAREIPRLLDTLTFKISMRWNETGVAFSRPIRWILALFGETVIPFTYAGIASGNTTRNLWSRGFDEVEISDWKAYQRFCKSNEILVENGSRRGKIAHQIRELVAELDCSIVEDAHHDALLKEVANLVESPTAFLGQFPPEFLELPRDVLTTVMRKHQRYFPVQDADGKLMNYFVGVRNGDNEHLDKVVHGNEKVLHARFADARFFFHLDTQKPLKHYLSRLETLTFQSELGSMRAKNDRVAATIVDLGHLLEFPDSAITIAHEAAQIAKADLATNMVVEMTSLQGIMGQQYALREGINSAVAIAIREHWLPAGLGDALPSTDAGRLLALADKFDSLVGLLAVGLAPTSSSDAFGLRRTALGILQILVNSQISVDLRPIIDRIASSQPVTVGLAHKQEALNFLRIRLENWFNDNVYVPIDVVKAVLTEQAHNPFRAVQGVDQLASWVRRDDWEAILDSFARCVRITRNETARQVNTALLTRPQESELYAKCLLARDSLGAESNVDDFLNAFEQIVPTVTAFFDNVLVHDDDIQLRNNRIALLQLISKMQNGRADLSKLENF